MPHCELSLFFAGSSGTERMSTQSPPIIMTLPPHLQAGIPDGYELVPVDRITDEYEIVPWKQVKTLLNISISQIDPAAHAGMCHSILGQANKDLWIF